MHPSQSLCLFLLTDWLAHGYDDCVWVSLPFIIATHPHFLTDTTAMQTKGTLADGALGGELSPYLLVGFVLFNVCILRLRVRTFAFVYWLHHEN